MKTFLDVDRLKVVLDPHRPLDPGIGPNLREAMMVRWTNHSNAIEGNTPTLQERSWSGVVHHARVFPGGCEIFYKQNCNFRKVCDHLIDKSAPALYDAQLGGHFSAYKTREGVEGGKDAGLVGLEIADLIVTPNGRHLLGKQSKETSVSWSRSSAAIRTGAMKAGGSWFSPKKKASPRYAVTSHTPNRTYEHSFATQSF